MTEYGAVFNMLFFISHFISHCITMKCGNILYKASINWHKRCHYIRNCECKKWYKCMSV